MPPIRTIFWDVGGVLLTNGWDHKERAAVLQHFGVDRGPVDERHTEANDIWEKGRISVWEYLDRTVFFEPRDFTPQQFFEAMKQQSQVLHPGSFRILRALAAQKKYRLAMLSNESAELTDFRLEKFGFRELFEVFFSSAYVGLRKPSQQIFEMALRVTQTNPQQAIFIDDREENCAGAAATGMRALQFKSPEQLAADLAALGVDSREGNDG